MVVSQAHGNRLIPSIHQRVRPSDLQDPVVREGRLLDQLPRCIESTEAASLVLFSQRILQASRAVGVYLRGTGTEIRFFVKCRRESLSVFQSGGDIRRR